jgi:MIP family channel proteins
MQVRSVITTMDKKALTAELMGTFALCFGGILSIHNSAGPNAGGSLLIPALAHGLILAVFISALGAISGGHFNPAVTTAMIASKRMKPNVGLGYIAAQIIGGVLAGVAVMACGLTKEDVVGGTPNLGPGVQAVSAIIAEAICTCFLVIAVLGTVVDKRAPKVGGLFIGLAVTIDILAIGPITGGAMNPARWLGPSLVTMQNLGNALVYITGPIIGCILAVLLYDKVMASDQTAE